LPPFGEELAVLVEDLQARVDTVGDKHAAGGIERDAVRLVELARPGAGLTPHLQHLAVGR
jgi:hypothetical protein